MLCVKFFRRNCVLFLFLLYFSLLANPIQVLNIRILASFFPLSSFNILDSQFLEYILGNFLKRQVVEVHLDNLLVLAFLDFYDITAEINLVFLGFCFTGNFLENFSLFFLFGISFLLLSWNF